MVHSPSSCLTMLCLVSLDNAVAMIGRFQIMCGLMEEMMMGSICSLTALLQLKFGLKVANHGYPRSTSSCPIVTVGWP
jgi:hypothetical protein